MKKLNTPIAIIFGLLSLVSLVGGDWLAAGLNALLAVGIWLSDLSYAPAGAGTSALPGALPPWRRYASLALVLTALALFGYQIGRDIQAKANRTTTAQAQ
jgi:hypothetical protein